MSTPTADPYGASLARAYGQQPEPPDDDQDQDQEGRHRHAQRPVRRFWRRKLLGVPVAVVAALVAVLAVGGTALAAVLVIQAQTSVKANVRNSPQVWWGISPPLVQNADGVDPTVAVNINTFKLSINAKDAYRGGSWDVWLYLDVPSDSSTLEVSGFDLGTASSVLDAQLLDTRPQQDGTLDPSWFNPPPPRVVGDLLVGSADSGSSHVEAPAGTLRYLIHIHFTIKDDAPIGDMSIVDVPGIVVSLA